MDTARRRPRASDDKSGEMLEKSRCPAAKHSLLGTSMPAMPSIVCLSVASVFALVLVLVLVNMPREVSTEPLAPREDDGRNTRFAAQRNATPECITHCTDTVKHDRTRLGPDLSPCVCCCAATQRAVDSHQIVPPRVRGSIDKVTMAS